MRHIIIKLQSQVGLNHEQLPPTLSFILLVTLSGTESVNSGMEE